MSTLADVYKKTPESFPGGSPVEEIKNRLYISPFPEEGVTDLINTMGVDNVLFGSDYPHPEGLARPADYANALGSLSIDDQAKIMGGNLSRLITV
jgi:predicted TIM-barrel fold metal-dependent hydrolase